MDLTTSITNFGIFPELVTRLFIYKPNGLPTLLGFGAFLPFGAAGFAPLRPFWAVEEPVAVVDPAELLGKPDRPSSGVVWLARGDAMGAELPLFTLLLFELPELVVRFPPPIWPTPGTPGMLPSPLPDGVPFGVP
jgi:hypothetical protein